MSSRTRLGAGAAVAFVLGLAASPALAAGDLAAAKAVVDAHTTLPTFVPPGEPFDAKKVMAGKKILTIPVSSANPFTKNIDLAMIAAAKEVGFEVVEWENQARPTQWVQGIEYAINNKFDAIDLLGGVDPAVLGPQIQEAKKAGVKVFVSHQYDTNMTPDPSVDLSLPIPYHNVGDILAAWVATKTQGNANVLIIGSDEIVPTKSFVKGITDGLAKYCGDGCKYELRQCAGAGVGDQDPAERAIGAARRSDDQLHHPDLRQHVAVRDPGGAHHRQAGRSEDRHLQRHAVRHRRHPQRRGRDGYRREPRLDRALDPRRLYAPLRRPARRQGALRPALYLRQIECRSRRELRRATIPATATSTSMGMPSCGC